MREIEIYPTMVLSENWELIPGMAKSIGQKSGLNLNTFLWGIAFVLQQHHFNGTKHHSSSYFYGHQ